MKNLPTLTGLRGAAALFVALGHLSNEGLFPSLLEGAAKIGVWVFFILSAYLMSKLYLSRDPIENVMEYTLARVGRVFPLYYTIIAVSFLFIGESYWRYDFENIRNSLYPILMISAPRELWAVPVEIHFYICFAIIWVYWQKFGRLSPFYTFAIFPVLLVSEILFTIIKWRAGIDINGLNLYLHIFLIGVGCAVYERPIATMFDKMEALLGRSGLSLLALVLLLASLPALRQEFGIHIGSRVDPIAVVASLFIFQLSLRSTGIFASLAHPIFLRLGTVSYGFYLLHHLVITWTQAHLGGVSPLLLTPSILIVSLALAELSFRVLERPASQAIRHLGAKRKLVKAK